MEGCAVQGTLITRSCAMLCCEPCQSLTAAALSRLHSFRFGSSYRSRLHGIQKHSAWQGVFEYIEHKSVFKNTLRGRVFLNISSAKRYSKHFLRQGVFEYIEHKAVFKNTSQGRVFLNISSAKHFLRQGVFEYIGC